MTPLVQVTPAEQLGALDAELAARAAGWRAVLRALARWSREQGADGLYLQVECDNAPAQALYASMGFERSHGCHFRVAP
jgi:hypothetical protein